jgi:AcrR family transcriptional regulator
MGMKGEETRSAILDAAMHVVRLEGLEGISIGCLARTVGLSKSGLFAHFKSKETLQLQVIERAASSFIDAVVRPAIKLPRGEPRVRALFDNWVRWADPEDVEGGCVFVGAAAELDDKPGHLRDALVRTQRAWIGALATAFQIAKDENHLSESCDPQQLAFELYAIMMAYHLYSRLLNDPSAIARARQAFEALLASAK